MPDTFFTAPAEWTWYIIPYFYIGGIAGGSFFIASMLYLFGRPEDRPVVRLGYYVALAGAMLSGPLLILDLGKPLRFWHMMLESETLQPMIKYWSPMSVGVWGLLIFSACALAASLGAATEERRFPWEPAGNLVRGTLGAIVAIVGGLAGFFLAGYTGVLLAVTNRPVWADSSWLGVLFLVSAASTAAAALILLSRSERLGCRAGAGTLDFLERFDRGALVLELVVLVVFVASLGAVGKIFLGWWGLLLVLGVLVAGILVPLAIGMGRLPRVRNRLATSAALVLFGGLMLRTVVLLSSEHVRVEGTRVLGH